MPESPQAVSPSWAHDQHDAFLDSRANRVARNAVTSSNVFKAARNASVMRTYHDTYSVSIPKTGNVTNQRQSGRCWMFSAFNVLRHSTMRLLDVDDFEFSQSFGMFYDKLEKANALLENVIALRDEPLDGREMSFVLEDGMGDGGYFNYAANLVRKWGVVPKSAMPETAASKNSSQMNRQLERLVRRDAGILRSNAQGGASAEELARTKSEMLDGVYRLLAICLGEPPQTFDLEVAIGDKAQVDESKVTVQLPEEPRAEGDAKKDAPKSRRVLRDYGLTPREFADRYVPSKPDDYVELVSIPGADREFNHAYHLTLSDSVLDGRPIRFLNVAPEVLDQAAVASLRAGEPCEMSCDVLQDFPRGIEDFPGILGTDTMDYEALFDVDLSMDRATMYDLHESSLTHAMTFQGVELDEAGEPVAWRVENSWGKDACKDGFLTVSADWFHTFGGEIAVRREFVPEDVLRMWDELPAEDVAPWSGMGCALAAGRRD